MPTIVHYRDKCIGCNVCYELWPVRWRMSTVDGKGTLVGGMRKKDLYIVQISDSEESINQQVAAACPVKIIKIH